jgi:uracil-DNA glycosylase
MREHATVVPTFHPSAINRRPGRRAEVAAGFRRAADAASHINGVSR